MGNESSAPEKIDEFVQIEYRVRAANGAAATLDIWGTKSRNVEYKNRFIQNIGERQTGFQMGANSPVAKAEISLIFSKQYTSGFLSNLFEDDDNTKFANMLPAKVQFKIYSRNGLIFSEKDVAEIRRWVAKFQTDVENVDEDQITFPRGQRQYLLTINDVDD